MSAEKYPSIFLRQMEAVYTLLKTGSLDDAVQEFSLA